MRLKLLLAGTVLPLCLWAVLPLTSDATPKTDRLGAIRSKLNQTQSRIQRRRGSERVLTTDIMKFDRRIDGLQTRVDALSGRVTRLTALAAQQERELGQVQSDLRAAGSRVVRLRSRLTQSRQALSKRLVELYEADRPDLVTVVLNSHGFADLLERADFLGRIADADRHIVTLVSSARQAAGQSTKQLAHAEDRQALLTRQAQVRRDALSSARRTLVTAQAGYAATRSERRQRLASVRVSRRELESEAQSLRAAEGRIQRTLRAAQARNAQSFPSAPAAPVRSGGGGPLIWPVNGPITSPFCERRSYEACHPGLDIGVPEGTPIRAAADGKVILLQGVGQSGGYGNYTCIQHTRQMSSCYAHQSRFGTTLGALVRQGQTIGYVGNTGHSFGAHLHWEVRINGVVTNPLNYV
jgi:murein DD-endopeptidase MepM/ murein hydrolase activator NlpD